MAGSDAYLDTLASVPLFSACSKKELQLVAKRGEQRRADAGTALVTEGAAGAEFFVILSGTAMVQRHGQPVATLGPGSWFGELSLLDRAPRNASVVAETAVELVVLGQRAFDELLGTVPNFDRKLLAGLARRLRQEDLKSVQ